MPSCFNVESFMLCFLSLLFFLIPPSLEHSNSFLRSTWECCDEKKDERKSGNGNGSLAFLSWTKLLNRIFLLPVPHIFQYTDERERVKKRIAVCPNNLKKKLLSIIIRSTSLPPEIRADICTLQRFFIVRKIASRPATFFWCQMNKYFCAKKRTFSRPSFWCINKKSPFLPFNKTHYR